MRRPAILGLLLAFLASSIARAQAPGANRPIGVPEGYVITPFGYFHPSCIGHLAGGDTLLEDGPAIRRANGTVEKFPACEYPHYTARGQIALPGSQHGGVPSISYAWVEDASAETTTSDPYGKLSAIWNVPPAPSSDDGQTVYFFPGFEQWGESTTILQPVLGWNADFSGAWGIASWNCCLQGNTYESPAVSVNPGDQIRGIIQQTCAAGTLSCGTWTVTTTDVTQGKATPLTGTTSAGHTFDWAGNVLEVYDVKQCSDYPPNSQLTFSDIALYDYNFNQISNPGWSPEVTADLTPECGYAVNAAATQVTLDYYAPGVQTVFAAGNFTLAQGASQSVGDLTLVMQADGNLVLYGPGGTAVWDTGTYGQDCGSNQCYATFQADGNFVVYNAATPLWSSGTFGNPGAELILSTQTPHLEITGGDGSVLWADVLQFSAGTFKLAQRASFAIGSLNLVMQADGNLVLYRQDGTAVWDTGTYGQDCGSDQCFATFQSDGNLVVYNGSTPLWSSGTFGNAAAELILSTQTPQLEIVVANNQSVLWSNVLQFSAGTFTLTQTASFAIGSLSLIMQGDGNLVLYQPDGTAVWSTGTYGQDCGSDQCFVTFQNDGNLVVYNGSTPLWSSGTFGNPGAELVLSTQTPQLEIIGSNQAVLWSNP